MVHTISTSNYKSNLNYRIKYVAIGNEKYAKLLEQLQNSKIHKAETNFIIDDEGFVQFKNTLHYVPNTLEIRQIIFDKVHKRPYSGHLGYQKLITTLKNEFYWRNMKRETLEYLAKCLECQQVKATHQHLAKFL